MKLRIGRKWTFIIMIGCVFMFSNFRAGGKISPKDNVHDNGRYDLIYNAPDCNNSLYSASVYGILFVNKLKDGDGSSWDSAMKELADALEFARNHNATSPINPVKEIWVAGNAEGNTSISYKPKYNPVTGANIEDDIANSFLLIKDIKIYGGFPDTANNTYFFPYGSSEEILNAIRGSLKKRNWNKWKTILSGDLGVIGDNSDNAQHVMVGVGPMGTAGLDGFVITDGGNDYTNPNGSMNYGSSNNVRNTFGGGLILCNVSDGITIKNVTFDNNIAYVGGGMASENSVCDLRNINFTNNIAYYRGGGFSMIYGGTATVTESNFENNSSQTDAGGGIYALSHQSLILNDILITNNKSTSGAGIYTWGTGNTSSSLFSNLIFTNNECSDIATNVGGGAIRISNDYVTIVNSLIANNKAESSGGAIYNSGNVQLINVTLVDNVCLRGDGGGIYSAGTSSSVIVENSIIWNNKKNLSINNFSVNNISAERNIFKYSILEGSGGSGNWSWTAKGVDSGNNLDTDPLLDGTFGLITCSPAIDAGNNQLISGYNYDLNEMDRIWDATTHTIGGIVDLGAYEYRDLNVCCPASNIVYVNSSYNGVISNGESWETPIKEFADALKMAKKCSNVEEIWVAGGTHYPKYDMHGINVTNDPEKGRNATFELIPGVKVYGGFAGTESSVAQRTNINPLFQNNPNQTILSGDIDYRGIPENIVFKDDYTRINADGLFINSDSNAYHVVVFKGDGTDVGHLDGFTIEGGNANFRGRFIVYPPGVDPPEPDPLDDPLTRRHMGGGIYVFYTSVKSKVDFKNLKVINNEATYGGGIVNFMFVTDLSGRDISSFENIVVKNNRATEWHASAISNHEAELKITNFDISDNKEIGTGVTTSFSSGVLASRNGVLILNNGKVTDNEAIGGGILIENRELSQYSYNFTNVTVSNNNSIPKLDLPALYNYSGGVNILYQNGPASQVMGNINNCIISGNTKGTAESGYSTSNLSLMSNTNNLWNVVQHSLIEGCGGSGQGWNTSFGKDGVDGTGGNNISENPDFINDGHSNYQLSGNSPATNVGNINLYTNAIGNIEREKDIAGNPRLQGVNISMGAYESDIDSNTFEIWNWEDLSRVMAKQTLGYTNFVLMQDLADTEAKSGDGTGAPETYIPAGKHKGNYGYNLYVENIEGGWTPIGSSTSPFVSNFDGNNKTISSFWIDRPSEDYQGLFGYVDQAEIKDIKIYIDGPKIITGKNYTGGLIGYVHRTSNITNCHATGDIIGIKDNTGLLIGGCSDLNSDVVNNSLISNCSAVGNVTGSMNVGLLVGFLGSRQSNTVVENCFSKGHSEVLTGYGGGLIGRMTRSNVNSSYSFADVNVTSETKRIGGLVGFVSVSNITDCYSVGSITGIDNIAGFSMGGFVGTNWTGPSKFKNCYSIGSVNGLFSSDGGFIGLTSSDLILENCYFNKETAGTSRPGIGIADLSGITAMTTQEIIEALPSGFGAEWDIDENRTYPYLKWQKNRADCEHTYNVSGVKYNINGGQNLHYTGPSIPLTNNAGDEIIFTVNNTNADRVYSPYCTDINFTDAATASVSFQLSKEDQIVSIGFASGSDIIHLKAPGLDYYVSVSGSGDKSGSDWENAMDDIAFTRALINAAEGAVFYVKEGVYNPRVGYDGNENPDPRYHKFVLNQGVTIIGSYKNSLTGTANDPETDRTLVDINGELMPSTVFSGDLNNDGTLYDPNNVYIVMDAQHNSLGAAITLNGVEITHGYMGAIVAEYADLIMDYCKVTKTRYETGISVGSITGGILRVLYGSLTIRNSEVSENMHTGFPFYGEVISAPIDIVNSTMNMYNCVVSNNFAPSLTASAIASTGTVNIYNSTITENTSEDPFIGAIYGERSSTMKIVNSTIARNVTTDSSPISSGISLFYQTTGFMSDFYPVDFTLDNSIIADNVGNIALVQKSSMPGTGVYEYDATNMFTATGYGEANRYQYSLIGDSYFDGLTLPGTDVDFNPAIYMEDMAYNGGLTKTMKLVENANNYAFLHGNPAYRGSADPGNDLNLDQREILRQDPVPCIGAYDAALNLGHVIRGTVFPFVYNGEEMIEFDTLFKVTAGLYAVPPANSYDPISEILEGTPIYISEVKNYDAGIFVPGTPKNPGQVGSVNNPGLPIDWARIGKIQDSVDETTLEESELPTNPIGLYEFNNVEAGDYVLVLSRDGYLTRFAKVTINSDRSLGHRELIPGDLNGDFIINSHDISVLISKMSSYGSSRYGAKYDINGDGTIDMIDVSLLIFYQSANMDIYNDTKEWILEY